MIDLKVQLKICEGCGVLWLRPTQPRTVYCSRCIRLFAEFRISSSQRPAAKPRLRRQPSPACRQLHLAGGAQ